MMTHGEQQQVALLVSGLSNSNHYIHMYIPLKMPARAKTKTVWRGKLSYCTSAFPHLQQRMRAITGTNGRWTGFRRHLSDIFCGKQTCFCFWTTVTILFSLRVCMLAKKNRIENPFEQSFALVFVCKQKPVAAPVCGSLIGVWFWLAIGISSTLQYRDGEHHNSQIH